MDLLLSSLRRLRAHAAFSALIVLLLALGIGANTAIFGVVHAVLLKPLPYPEPGRSKLVSSHRPPCLWVVAGFHPGDSVGMETDAHLGRQGRLPLRKTHFKTHPG